MLFNLLMNRSTVGLGRILGASIRAIRASGTLSAGWITQAITSNGNAQIWKCKISDNYTILLIETSSLSCRVLTLAIKGSTSSHRCFERSHWCQQPRSCT
jgi:hypothetical protein